MEQRGWSGLLPALLVAVAARQAVVLKDLSWPCLLIMVFEYAACEVLERVPWSGGRVGSISAYIRSVVLTIADSC